MTKSIVARANLLVFGVMVTILLMIGGLIWDRSNAAQSARQWSRHSYEVLDTIKDLNLAVRQAETGQRGYLLTDRDDYLAPYQSALGRVSFLQGELQRLTADNVTEQQRLRALSPILQHKLEELAQTVELRRDIGFDAAMRVVQTHAGQDLMRDIEVTRHNEQQAESARAAAHHRG